MSALFHCWMSAVDDIRDECDCPRPQSIRRSHNHLSLKRFVPGGAGAAIKAVRGVNAIDDAVDTATTAKRVDRAGMDFTKKPERDNYYNAAKHGGKNVCEGCGTDVVPAQQSKKGVRPPDNERHRDHIDPKANGGSGTPPNGQVLCRKCNIDKSDKPPQPPPCTPGSPPC